MSVNQAGSGLLGANSNPLVFQAQFVSLVPAATKVLYGKALTLSGRITSHKAGEIITILGWKYGHSAPVKTSTATTRDGGFLGPAIVDPSIQTTYEALWGKAHSGKVMIGVEPMVTLSRLPDGSITSHVGAGASFAGEAGHAPGAEIGPWLADGRSACARSEIERCLPEARAE